jgi:GH24 family phage-related lysozyme (muramidase)
MGRIMTTDHRRSRTSPPALGRHAAALVVAGLALIATAACDPTPDQVGPAATALASGASIRSGGQIVSPSGRFRLVMQTDGNLVERSPSGRALWTSKTTNNAGAKLLMRSDGILLVQTTTGRTIWSTPTSGVRGARAELGDDANLVVRGTAGNPVWANGTSAASGTRLPVSDRHTSSQQVTLTKIYEGLVGVAPYNNANSNCTVGYGHLIHMDPCTTADRSKTYNVDALFAADVTEHERRLASSLGHLPVSQREYDTLWDYVYGRGSLTASTAPNMYAALTDDPIRYADVPGILRANGDIQSLRGLCDRRYDEAEVFAGGPYDRTYTC